MTHPSTPPDSELQTQQPTPESATNAAATPPAAGKAAPTALQRTAKLVGAGALMALAVVAVGMSVNSDGADGATCPMGTLGARVAAWISGPTCSMSNAPKAAADRPSPASSVAYVTADSFQAEVIEASQPVLVKFTARWCGQCRVMKPTVEALARERADDVLVLLVDADKDEALARQLGVNALPTFMVYRDGEVVATQVGAYGRQGLDRLLGQAGL